MPVSKKLKTESKTATSRRAASKQAEATVVLEAKKTSNSRKGSSKDNDKEKAIRGKILSERFVPETVSYLKDNFGIDVQTIPVQALYDIAHGNVTQPLEAVLSPRGFDRDAKTEVDLPKIRTVSSFLFILPSDNEYKPVAPDKKHPVYVQAFPCHEYVQKSDKAVSVETANVEDGLKRDDFKFTNAQVLALEGVGIAGDRLFGGFNALSVEQLQAARDGVPFEFDGVVKTLAGFINVAGTATLKENASGEPVVRFEPNGIPQRGENDTLDLLTVSKIGNLELDFYERSKMTGEILHDSQDRPMINKAGRDLLAYGITMEPVKGVIHLRTWDDAEKEWRSNNQTNFYQVSVVNGSLVPSKMVKVIEKDDNGKDIMIGSGKNAFAKYHYEVANARVNKDGTIRLANGVSGTFTSADDIQNYRMGKGAVVKDAVWKTRGKDGKEKSVTYDAYVVPDPLRGGFARQFSPDTSASLIERNKPKVKKTQNFGLGF